MKQKKLTMFCDAKEDGESFQECVLRAIQIVLISEQGGINDEKNSGALCPFIPKR